MINTFKLTSTNLVKKYNPFKRNHSQKNKEDIPDRSDESVKNSDHTKRSSSNDNKDYSQCNSETKTEQKLYKEKSLNKEKLTKGMNNGEYEKNIVTKIKEPAESLEIKHNDKITSETDQERIKTLLHVFI